MYTQKFKVGDMVRLKKNSEIPTYLVNRNHIYKIMKIDMDGPYIWLSNEKQTLRGYHSDNFVLESEFIFDKQLEDILK